LAVSRFSVAKEEGHDMGNAAGTALHAAEIFASCESVLKAIPADYRSNWQKKYE